MTLCHQAAVNGDVGVVSLALLELNASLAEYSMCQFYVGSMVSTQCDGFSEEVNSQVHQSMILPDLGQLCR